MFSELNEFKKSVAEYVKAATELFVISFQVGAQVSREQQARKKLEEESPKIIGFRLNND